MRILNFGSLNIDHVYQVEHFVKPGETIGSDAYQQYCGGKGLNQSIALACAGAQVYHAGKVGGNGGILLDMLKEKGVHTDYVKMDPSDVSGHAIIQVSKSGENCIILYGGTNQNITREEIKNTLSHFLPGDYLLLQNEINHIEIIMRMAKEQGLKIVINPAPMNRKVLQYPLELVDLFVVNEVEGNDLTGAEDPDAILEKMLEKFPFAASVLTLGPKGIKYADANRRFYQPADPSVNVVDTTAAGDTFIGFFLGSIANGKNIKAALNIASKACDICVAREGASISIPNISEVI